MQPFLVLPVVAQSVISTSTITLIPGLVLGLCMMFDQWRFIRMCSMFFRSCIFTGQVVEISYLSPGSKFMNIPCMLEAQLRV